MAAIAASLYLLHATTQSLRVARVATEVAHRGLEVIEETYPNTGRRRRRLGRPSAPAVSRRSSSGRARRA